jgi:hypothetical protein
MLGAFGQPSEQNNFARNYYQLLWLRHIWIPLRKTC